MHIPTKTQWQTVIDNFKKVLPMATMDKHLDMKECVVHQSKTVFGGGHKCGTIHCMGGWYAIAVLSKEELQKSYVSYTQGTQRMAEDLGFNEVTDLEWWAEKTPAIWGNVYGFSMFSNEAAYNYAKTLAEAVAYLEGVRDRSSN